MRKRERRKLDNIKCAQCRHDKVKCSPQPRLWPQKCERCESKGFACSEGEVKRRTRRRVSPTSPRPSSSETTHLNDQVSNIRRGAGQVSVELGVERGEGKWDCTDLMNLVTFVQLLNHERSLLAAADFNVKKCYTEFEVADLIEIPSEAAWLEIYLPILMKDARKELYDRQESESLKMTDRILYENAHEAIGEDFVVPRHDPVSEEFLAKLPVGVQIRYLIRKLRLDIQRCGWCDFERLDELVSQLMPEHSAWHEHFNIAVDYHLDDFPFMVSNIIRGAAYSLVVSQELSIEPLTRIWIRDQIMRYEDETSRFPVTRFVKLWNAENGSADLVALCEGAKLVEGRRAGNGDLPLHIAARNGHKGVVDYILSIHSDDKNYVNKRGHSASDNVGKTALVHAGENENIFRLLLSKFTGQYFNTPFVRDGRKTVMLGLEDMR
ncbi:hypothetical protein CGGC5_v008268 [Colletotrichum fructicola Nara gc5]|uniref:Zn(2)-C6 fungal-type domain-containing protein n=1 Tax=Colletotrichum fructicola (strain Nara gc5) TaxID=1213859 RepID=A0A7J6J4V4_COLFN|nr:hypothetical protein CGGC5_v008268 [Colletotrichum fructicola Nara gc5]